MVVQTAPVPHPRLTQEEFEVRHVLYNPFRRLHAGYPVVEVKVERLIESYKQSGFWGNLVARRISATECQLAYGTHRRRAMDYTHKPTDLVPIIIRDLSDAEMLQLMAAENMSEFGASALVDLETVYATVLAFGQGQITLPTVGISSPKSEIRNAPSFIPGNYFLPEKRYNAQTIGQFLGWVVKGKDGQMAANRKIHMALLGLEYIELGHLKESDFEGLSSASAEEILRVAGQRRREHEERAKYAEAQARNREAERKHAQVQAAKAKAEGNRQEAAQRRREERAAQVAQREAERRAATEREAGKKKAATIVREVAKKRRDPLNETVRIREEADRIAPLRQDSKEALRIQKLEINRQAVDIASEIWGILNDKPNPPRLADPLALKIQQIAADAHYLIGSTEKLTRIISALTQLVSRAEELIGLLNQARANAEKPAASSRPLLRPPP